MKLNGIFGTGSGKVGASVWAVSSGVQIVRPYQPNVTNPNTDAQVAQRAKLKLMSQVAAALASIIAFKKDGLVSARNRFVSANIGLCTFENGQADVRVQNLIIAPGSRLISDISVSRSSANQAEASVTGLGEDAVDLVVYAVARFTEDEKLAVVSVKSAEAGSNNRFATVINVAAEKCVCFAYGVKLNSASVKNKYADYIADATTDSAFVDTILPALVSNGNTTESVGIILAASN